MKQAKIKDNGVYKEIGAIILENGDAILCDCGDLISKDEIGNGKTYEIVEVYDYWVDLTEEIIGN